MCILNDLQKEIKVIYLILNTTFPKIYDFLAFCVIITAISLWRIQCQTPQSATSKISR